MRILIVKTVPGDIPIQNVTYNNQEFGIAVALRKKGHVCDVLCCTEGKFRKVEIKDKDNICFSCFFIPSWIILKNGFPKNADRIFAQYDILSVSEYNQLFTWHLAGKYKDKTVVWHGPYYNVYNKRYNLMCQIFDAIFLRRYIKNHTPCLTKSELATSFLKEKGIEDVTTVGVGINIDSLEGEDTEVPAFADEISEFNVEYKLLYIGRIEERRNCLFIIDVLKAIHNKGIKAGLVLIGRGDNKYTKQFFRKVDESNLRPYVLYTESLEQKYMRYIYKRCDVFILPTVYDIYGMVILESMYYGVPCVTSVNGGSRTMIENYRNGVVIENFNVGSWSNEIVNLLKNKPLMNEISVNSSFSIRNAFTWDSLVDKMLIIYEKKQCIDNTENL